MRLSTIRRGVSNRGIGRNRRRRHGHLRPPTTDPTRAAALSRTPPGDAFVTGNGIAASCRYVLNYDALVVNEEINNDWWFCKSDFLEFFFAAHAPDTPFVLLSHNSDRAIGEEFRSELDRKRLVAWFAQNATLAHPKLKALAIGIANPYWPHGDQEAIRRVQDMHLPKEALFDASFDIATNSRAREYCVARTGLVPGPKRPFVEYLESLASAYFCISPEGNGLDCTRTWEALCVRTVPVVTRSLVTEHHADVPMLVLEDWDEFADVDFSPSLYNEVWREWDPACLHVGRYLTRVEVAAEKLRSAASAH